jgi:hypothetical protein
MPSLKSPSRPPRKLLWNFPKTKRCYPCPKHAFHPRLHPHERFLVCRNMNSSIQLWNSSTLCNSTLCNSTLRNSTLCNSTLRNSTLCNSTLRNKTLHSTSRSPIIRNALWRNNALRSALRVQSAGSRCILCVLKIGFGFTTDTRMGAKLLSEWCLIWCTDAPQAQEDSLE